MFDAPLISIKLRFAKRADLIDLKVISVFNWFQLSPDTFCHRSLNSWTSSKMLQKTLKSWNQKEIVSIEKQIFDFSTSTWVCENLFFKFFFQNWKARWNFSNNWIYYCYWLHSRPLAKIERFTWNFSPFPEILPPLLYFLPNEIFEGYHRNNLTKNGN